ncbi:hypothetical protein JCM1841_004313 [Sporobolomyces salmonicolor]
MSDKVALSATATSGSRRTDEGASRRISGAPKLRFKDSSTSSTAKRQRTLTLPAISLEGSMSEEILLRCLSYLSASDLVTVSRVSSAWYRLSQDPQLWRSLYLRKYASASTRRQALSGSPIARSRPWRELYKISTNWRSGTAKSSTLLGQTVRKAVLAEVPNDLALSGGETTEQESVGYEEGSVRVGDTRETTDTLLQFYQHYFFTASRSPSTLPDTLPSITVHQTLPTGDSFVLARFTSTRLCDFYSSRPDFRPSLAITELRLDEASARTGHPSHLLLAVFYSTGQFSVFRLTLPSTSASFFAREVYISLALNSPLSHPFISNISRFDPVGLARLHSPLLVTCSRSFTLRFLRVVETEGEEIELEETETPLQSRESWAPVSLTLATIDERGGETRERDWEGKENAKEEGDQKFKVTLAYSTPVFPASWTVGIQEFDITIPPIPSRKDVAAPLPALARPRLSITARHASAPPLHTPLPSTPRRTNVFSPPGVSSQSPVTSIEHADPFIVTSRVDNTIDVYEVTSLPLSLSSPRPPPPTTTRLHLSTRAPPPTLPSLRIEHRRTLFGHTARVSSVAISTTEGGEQKCISAGDDGAVKVWSLGPAAPGAGKKRAREGATTVIAREQDEVEPASEWQQMKRRRSVGLRGRAQPTLDGRDRDIKGGEGDRPERIKRVFVDEDKIVVVGSGRGGGEGERVRVLRFD